MAHRRGSTGLASAIDLATTLMLSKAEHDQKLNEEAVSLRRKFDYERQLKQIEQGWVPDAQTGAMRPPRIDDYQGMLGALQPGQKLSIPLSGGASFTAEEPKEKSPLERAKQTIEAVKAYQALQPPTGGWMGTPIGQHAPALPPSYQAMLDHAMQTVGGGSMAAPSGSGASAPITGVTSKGRRYMHIN